MAPLPAPAEKPSHRISESQSHAKLSPPAQVAVFCPALWPNLQPALTDGESGMLALSLSDSEMRSLDRFDPFTGWSAHFDRYDEVRKRHGQRGGQRHGAVLRCAA